MQFVLKCPKTEARYVFHFGKKQWFLFLQNYNPNK